MTGNPFEKIQNLSKRKRKIIFWLLMVIITSSLGFVYLKNFQKQLKILKIEELGEEIPKPEIELPEIDTGDLEELKKQLEKMSP